MKAGTIQLFLFSACALLAWPMGLRAEGEKINFTTADGVKIRGAFYASAKKKAPVVIMLHALGEDSKKKSWQSLAEELQKGGLNVLTFDFRGHGESTEVDDLEKFWSEQGNFFAAGKTGFKKRTIEYKNFDKRYYPYMINDIAAARSYLERTKNDDGSCSTSNIVVIGAETGATLGAAWITSEWYRHKFTPPVMAGMAPDIEKRKEGKDIIGAIWLSISPTLGDKRPVKLESMVRVPAAFGNTSMLFLYGEEDKVGKKVAKSCETLLKKEEKNKYTLAYELKGSKLTGAELLQKSLKTEERVVEYLLDMVENKANEWAEREFKKSFYCRITPDVPTPIVIKLANDTNLAFEAYDKFVPYP